ncbi:hypothetical protein RHMOL_Rhmol10G0265900 [Rhododendron molle]|uniref:Uncharacterized protein n=1 Tax=Rhododendron molle TaxID=49168 RepID=A0ACC0M888_RHOML|nr:hypothetical protein RHMOL_Rhmol10G0265900 [Rhododendron molle]
MIIPVDDEWDKPLDEGVFDLQTHLLHGLIHCNGFGHLICINGIEGGSKNLCGREVMDLWDRICSNLHARQITVEDDSKKHSMDLRLLHGVAYGHPWFGRWGYRFCNGSFGVTQHKYEKALEILSLLELDKITHDFTTGSLFRDFKHIIHYYRDLSETKLITLRDLLRFMLALKSRVPFQRRSASVASTSISASCSKPVTKSFAKEKPVRCRKFSNVAASLNSRWPVRRLEHVADVVAHALKEKKVANKGFNCGMTRQEARDAARLQIGDTGLIDYVLKSMNNVVVGGLVIRRNVNRSTGILEFSIEEGRSDSQVHDTEQELEAVHKPVLPPAFSPGIDVYKDVDFVYRNVLTGYPVSQRIVLAAQTVLDTKHFVKEWPFKDEEDELLRFICRVVLNFRDSECDFSRWEFSHGEIIVLPLHSTFGDLKSEVENAMRDTYCVTESLVVTEIEGMEGIEDCEVLFGLVESGSEIRVKGFGSGSGSELKYESGVDNWTVRCRCGARDDDGERMVACDICEVWQHTRCCGIEDSDAVPPLFLCAGCCASLVPSVADSSLVFEEFGMESGSGLWEL